MSKIILLNGAGSSGKTSIAKSIQYLSDDPWITFGIDTFIDMTPAFTDENKNKKYLSFTPGKNEYGQTIYVESHENGRKLFETMPDFAKLLADKGQHIIIDEVLFDDDHLKSYIHQLSDHIVYFVGVYCDLSVMRNREILRGNRAIGLSNDQFDRVHQGLREYDMIVNTNQSDFFENAKTILRFIEDNDHPSGFCKMRKTIGC